MTQRKRLPLSPGRRLPLLAAALLATTAAAHEPDGSAARPNAGDYRTATVDSDRPMPPIARHFMRAMADELELTAGQRGSIRSLMERELPRMQELREEQFANRQRLIDASPYDVDYDSVVQEVAEANGRLTAEGVRLRGQLRAEVHALLTPEQRLKAREVRETMRLRMAHRLSHGPESLF